MKRNIGFTAVTAAFCLVMLAGCGSQTTGQGSGTPLSQTTPAVQMPSEYITEEQARALALEHAGVSENEASFVRTHMDWDNGKWKYEVEFYKDTAEYDYDVDAVTGEILSYDYDAEYYSLPSVGPVDGAKITEDEAKQIALEHAGMTEDSVSRLRIEFDYEHGKAVYDVEWRIDWTEYSYEIDANSGEILSHERDTD